jgi:hypothetical protein
MLSRTRWRGFTCAGDRLGVFSEEECRWAVRIADLDEEIAASRVGAADDVFFVPLGTEANIDREWKELTTALVGGCRRLGDTHATFAGGRARTREATPFQFGEGLHEPELDPAPYALDERGLIC